MTDLSAGNEYYVDGNMPAFVNLLHLYPADSNLVRLIKSGQAVWINNYTCSIKAAQTVFNLSL
jgi:hypothetical protein